MSYSYCFILVTRRLMDGRWVYDLTQLTTQMTFGLATANIKGMGVVWGGVPKNSNNMNKKTQAELHQKNERYKSALRNRATDSEIEAEIILSKLGTKIVFQKGFYTTNWRVSGLHYIVDFYLPEFMLAVEIDGGYHEGTKEKDKFRDDWIFKHRFVRTIRIKNKDVSNIIEILNEFMNTPNLQGRCHLKQWNKLIDKYKGKKKN